MARKKTKKKNNGINLGQVIIPTGHPNPPEQHEIEAAWILARHYCCTVEFLIPVDDYKRKSADIVMLGVEFEIKSPIGHSKSTIGNQFKVASRQSRNIVIDTRRTALTDAKIEKDVLLEMKKRTTIKKVILIAKNAKVLDLTK